MTDRPILFSAPMILALLDGRKTQTRRILKLTPPDDAETVHAWFAPAEVPTQGIPNQWAPSGLWAKKAGVSGYNRYCGTLPYRPGDRLWVKETWRAGPSWDETKPSLIQANVPVDYCATPRKGGPDGKARVSIFMPRWASRLTLLVTDVRVQRLQDCSEADAIAEGIIEYEPTETDPSEFSYVDGGDIWNNARSAYAALWDSINDEPGKRWADNPWIVAVTFSVEMRNIDEVRA